MSNEKVCLQCGLTREEAKGDYCITLSDSDYDQSETDWEQHHWRDWSNKSLKEAGIHPSLWEANRRASLYELERLSRVSYCLKKGEHEYINIWLPLTDTDLIDCHQEIFCIRCYKSKDGSITTEKVVDND